MALDLTQLGHAARLVHSLSHRPSEEKTVKNTNISSTMALGAGCLLVAALSTGSLAAGMGSEGDATIWDGIYTKEQAERGKSLYASGCAECHGAGMEGDDMSPALVGSDFLWNWNGLSVGDLFERLRISMPEGNPNSMTVQEKADVLAYMLEINQYPTGKDELPPRASELNTIEVEAVKPE